MRKIGKDRITCQRFPLQSRHDTNSVEYLIRFSINVQQLQNRRIEVTALNNFIAAGTSFDNTGIGHNRGASNTTFVHIGFPASQRKIAGSRGSIHFVVHVSAVVGGEYDDGVISQL